MRVTQIMMTRTALANVARNRVRLQALQEKASSGLDINRPSDDPTGASGALLLKSAIAATKQLERGATAVRNRVREVDSAIDGATTILIRARELAVQGANDTLDAQARSLLAQEIEGLFEQMMSEGNKTSSGGFLFSGIASTSVAFTASGPFTTGLPSPTVSFGGDSNVMQAPIDEGIVVPTSLDGRRVFLGDSDGDGSPDGGREDLFAVLGTLRDALLANDRVAVNGTLTRLDAGIDQLTEERARIGVIDTKVARAEDRLAERYVQLERRLSDVQDADAAEVYSGLVNQETALRASLDATGRLVQPTLLDFLF